MKRVFDPTNHCCSQCGTLLTKEAFRYHTTVECFMAEIRHKELEEMVNGKTNKKGGYNGMS